MLAKLINRDCVIFARSSSGEVDDYGNDIPDEGAVQTVCEMQPRSAVEPQNQADLSDEDWTGFFFPTDASSLNSASAVWVPELGEFEIEGMPPVWRNPRTQQAEYVQANLRRTAGPEDSRENTPALLPSPSLLPSPTLSP